MIAARTRSNAASPEIAREGGCSLQRYRILPLYLSRLEGLRGDWELHYAVPCTAILRMWPSCTIKMPSFCRKSHEMRLAPRTDGYAALLEARSGHDGYVVHRTSPGPCYDP